MATRTRKPKAPELVTVTLKRDHTHLGVSWAAGAVLAVHPRTARWLLDGDIATPTETATPNRKD